MRFHQWLKNKTDSFENDFEFRLETVIYRITEKIAARMEEIGINRVELAEKMDVSSAYVTKLLRGTSNFTIRTLMRLADTLDQDLVLDFKDRQVVPQTNEQVLEKSATPTLFIPLAIEASEKSSATETWYGSYTEDVSSPYIRTTSCD